MFLCTGRMSNGEKLLPKTYYPIFYRFITRLNAFAKNHFKRFIIFIKMFKRLNKKHTILSVKRTMYKFRKHFYVFCSCMGNKTMRCKIHKLHELGGIFYNALSVTPGNSSS